MEIRKIEELAILMTNHDIPVGLMFLKKPIIKRNVVNKFLVMPDGSLMEPFYKGIISAYGI